MFCGKCGSNNNQENQFCSGCGTAIATNQAQPNVNQNIQQPVQQNQFNQGGQFSNQPPAKKKKTWLYIIGGIVGFFVIMIAVALIWLSRSQTATEIRLGNDTIPTVYAIVGQRRITGVSSSRTLTSRERTLTYGSGVISREDIYVYLITLIERYNFAPLEDIDTDNTIFNGTIATESRDPGKIILVEIQFRELGYTVINYRKTEGTLTRH